MIISRLLLAGIAAFGVSSATLAADLIIDEPETIFEPEPVASWDGFYLGVHVGGGWGFADHTSQVPGNDLALAGWLAGVQAGANFTVSDPLVLGFEADASWANITGSDSFGVGDITHSIDWMASLRGKLGVNAGMFLPYLTAGLAVAGATRDVTTNGTPPASNTHFGWTAGIGTDVAVMDNVSLNFEYRFTDLGAQVYPTGGIAPTVSLMTHTVRAGVNFRF